MSQQQSTDEPQKRTSLEDDNSELIVSYQIRGLMSACLSYYEQIMTVRKKQIATNFLMSQ